MNYALVTGASGGIGYAVAHELAKRGYNLILVARNESRLEAVASEIRDGHGVDAQHLAVDLSHPHASTKIFDFVATQDIFIEVLINNAGFASFGPFKDAELTNELAMIQVNITALTELARRFIPAMVEKRSGYIMNVASLAAFQPGPLMAVYYASKAYVLSFSEAIANELHEHGIKVHALCPGPVATGFQGRAAMEDSKLVQGKKLMSAQKVAELAVKKMFRGKRSFIPGFKYRLLAFSTRFASRRSTAAIARAMQERKGH